MAALYKGKIPIITRDLNEGFIRGTPDAPPSTGCVPRDYDLDPVLMRDAPSGIDVIDPSEYDARFDAGDEAGDTLEHVYLRAAEAGQFEPLDQNGFPDCWAHSPTHAVMVNRLLMGLPYVKLNAVAVATMLGQTNGGWAGLGMKFIRDSGVPEAGDGPGQWPYQSRKGRDTPELRANMARYRDVEDWYDLGRKEWDQHLANKQLDTCLFNNCPSPSDYNPYSHSMLSLRKVRIEKGHWGRLTLNSWKGFGYHGLCVITIDPDNAVSLRASTPSAK